MIRALPLLLAIDLAGATYEDPAGKFHFDLPSGWTARVQGRLPDETPLSFARGGFSCDVTVLVQEGGGTIQEAAHEIEAALVVQGDVEREEISVDGAPAVRLTLSPDDESLGITSMLVVLWNDTRIIVELRADRDAWRRDRAQYDAVLAGFHMGKPQASGMAFEPDFDLKDDGTQLVPGTPPLNMREVSGCLGAVEFAYGIELTEGEKERLLKALVGVFRAGDREVCRELASLSEEGWRAREAAPGEIEAARKAIAERLQAGTTEFDQAVKALVAATSPVVGKPAEHDVAAIEEWAAFVLLLAARSEEARPSPAWSSWAQSEDAVSDVEWMAIRAAFSLASDRDRQAYRDRLLAALGGTEEEAKRKMSEVTEEEVPTLGAKLREAARSLLDTMSPPVDLADPSKNGAYRYRY